MGVQNECNEDSGWSIVGTPKWKGMMLRGTMQACVIVEGMHAGAARRVRCSGHVGWLREGVQPDWEVGLGFFKAVYFPNRA